MSEPQPDGPFAHWVNLLTSGPSNAMKQWEGWFGQQLDKFVRSETFLERMGKAMEGSFQFKAALDRALDQSLRNVRVPPMGDLLDVFKRLDALERGLDQANRRFDAVNDRLDHLADLQAQVLAALKAQTTQATQAAPAQAPQAEATQAEASKPEATKPEATKPDAGKSGAARKPRNPNEAAR